MKRDLLVTETSFVLNMVVTISHIMNMIALAKRRGPSSWKIKIGLSMLQTMVAKIDTGSEISCINQYILNKSLSHITINECKGQLTFLAIDNNKNDTSVQRIGVTEPIKLTYVNNISFNHSFEVVKLSKVLETEFDVLLVTDILLKLGIALTGVAYC
jgi:hypothetical protein